MNKSIGNRVELLMDQMIATIEQENSHEILLLAVTGVFVSVVLGVLKAQGADINKKIEIDGGLNRNIAIHAPVEIEGAK